MIRTVKVLHLALEFLIPARLRPTRGPCSRRPNRQLRVGCATAQRHALCHLAEGEAAGGAAWGRTRGAGSALQGNRGGPAPVPACRASCPPEEFFARASRAFKRRA